MGGNRIAATMASAVNCSPTRIGSDRSRRLPRRQSHNPQSEIATANHARLDRISTDDLHYSQTCAALRSISVYRKDRPHRSGAGRCGEAWPLGASRAPHIPPLHSRSRASPLEQLPAIIAYRRKAGKLLLVHLQIGHECQRIVPSQPVVKRQVFHWFESGDQLVRVAH